MSNQEVRLRVKTLIAPAIFEGRKTEFGIQDKKQVLHPAQQTKTGLELTVLANAREADGFARFSGPFIHRGNEGRQHLYIGWRQLGAETWINRLKVQLEMPWTLAAEASAGELILEADATELEWGTQRKWRPNLKGDWQLHNQ